MGFWPALLAGCGLTIACFAFAALVLKRFGIGLMPYVTIGGVRQLYTFPDSGRLDVRIGYERKFQRFRWSTQLNVQNILDDQEQLHERNASGAIFDLDIRDIPRTIVWSNTFRF